MLDRARVAQTKTPLTLGVDTLEVKGVACALYRFCEAWLNWYDCIKCSNKEVRFLYLYSIYILLYLYKYILSVEQTRFAGDKTGSFFDFPA